MITETQKGLIDMLHKKGAPQTATDVEQTLRTLHWTEDDIRDAVAYYNTLSPGGAAQAVVRTEPVSISGYSEKKISPSPVLSQGTETRSGATFVVPKNAFVGGPVSESGHVNTITSKIIFLIILLGILCVLGVAIFLFREPLVKAINDRFYNNVNQIVVETASRSAAETNIDATNNEPQNNIQSPNTEMAEGNEAIILTSTGTPLRTLPIQQVAQESVLQNQLAEIALIRKAIATHYMLYADYPNTLSDLLNPVDAKAIKQNAIYPIAIQAGQPLLSSISDTMLQNKYTKVNNDYDLEYIVSLPAFETVSNPYSFIGIQRFDLATKKIFPSIRGNKTYHDASYDLFSKDVQAFPTRMIVMLLRDGRNTATRHTISKEMWALQEKDTDGDLLSDALETYIKSNVNNKDTDGDGVHDGEEFKQRKNILEK